MKRFLLMIIPAVLIMIGCSKSEPQTTWTFANHANQTVYIFNISPKGQPSSLELLSDTTTDLTISGDKIDYDFGPADAIMRQRDENSNVITFYDKE